MNLKANVLRLVPGVFWRRAQRRFRALGGSGLWLLFSFDCDTDADIDAAARLAPDFRARAWPLTLAVPGSMIERHAAACRDLAAGGTAFLNHGYLPHAEFRNGSYHSATFYHEMPPAAVEEDVRRGHATLVQLLGVTPSGFRAPHFGYVQAPEQLARLYAVLGSLGGYRFSSSTLPASAWARGPAFAAAPGLTEIPVSGSYRKPLHVLDSWNFLTSPGDVLVPPRYGATLRDTVGRLHARGSSALLNYYADPAHVAASEPFRDALRYAANLGVETIGFDTLLQRLGTMCFAEAPP